MHRDETAPAQNWFRAVVGCASSPRAWRLGLAAPGLARLAETFEIAVAWRSRRPASAVVSGCSQDRGAGVRPLTCFSARGVVPAADRWRAACARYRAAFLSASLVGGAFSEDRERP